MEREMDSKNVKAINVKQPHCDICVGDTLTSHTAVGYCENCDEHLCENCYNYHSKPKASRSHVIFKLSGSNANSAKGSISSTPGADITSEKCPKHSQICIDFYCEDHDLVGCGTCIVLGHKECKTVYLRGLEKGMVNEYSDTLKELEINITEIEADVKSHSEESTKNKDESIHNAEQHRNQIVEKLDSFHLTVKNTIFDCYKRNEQTLLSISDTCRDSKKKIEGRSLELDALVQSNQLSRLYISSKRAAADIQNVKQCLKVASQKMRITTGEFKPNNALTDVLSNWQVFGTFQEDVNESEEVTEAPWIEDTKPVWDDCVVEGEPAPWIEDTKPVWDDCVVEGEPVSWKQRDDCVVEGEPAPWIEDTKPVWDDCVVEGEPVSWKQRDDCVVEGEPAPWIEDTKPVWDDCVVEGEPVSWKQRDDCVVEGEPAPWIEDTKPVWDDCVVEGEPVSWKQRDDCVVEGEPAPWIEDTKPVWDDCVVEGEPVSWKQRDDSVLEAEPVRWKQRSERNLEDENCVICMDSITDPKELPCGHRFCTECIEQQFKFKKVCPTCGKVCGIITGDQPLGTMTISTNKYQDCAGYPGIGWINITYSIPNGTQGSEHPSPGQRYDGIRRSCYLPNNNEGRDVCQMLKVAFKRKLIFTIGVSRTTGKEGVVAWNDIQHKTDHRRHSQFGYPDPGYLDRVTEELAANGVTKDDIYLSRKVDETI